ncbi:hypothetical protein [Candidatus Pelagibacter sp. HIMB1611]|uniref:hypothetical protein n=1 Tax=Candidatus Pelagibacter sp. HIMB1611 TaxID=3413357 RepID=UPI003F84A946
MQQEEETAMLKYKHKFPNPFGWLLDKFNNFKSEQLKYHESLWSWFHWTITYTCGKGLYYNLLSKFYYPIRNYQKWVRFGERVGKRTDVLWNLSKPLTLTFITEDKGYCPTCHERAVENGDAENNDWYKFFHADYNHHYETNLLLSNKKYTYTYCCCEDLLFEPLEEYYTSGGESGSSMFTQECAQWDINKDIRPKNGWDPLKEHKAQKLPKGWRFKNDY